jgi:Xaa-Pro aminopeptidase
MPLTSLARFPGAESLPALERCAAIADAGFAAIVEKAKVGMFEYELAAEMEYAMRSRGAEDNFGMLTASDHSHCAHPPQDRKIQPGDIVIAEITPSLDGHFIQLCRTAVVGAPSPLLREKFASLEEALAKSLDKVRPGAKVGEISQAMNQVFTAYGYEKYCRPPYMRVRGHGLGLLSIPFAEIVDENETVIEAGTMFVVHPNQYIPETGYLMLGDTVWVEENGYLRLTQTPMKLFSIENYPDIWIEKKPLYTGNQRRLVTGPGRHPDVSWGLSLIFPWRNAPLLFAPWRLARNRSRSVPPDE